MAQFITAMFADGVLKPEQELGIASGTRVQLFLESGDDVRIAREQALADLDHLCEHLPIVSDGSHLTRDELHERR